MGWEIKVSGVTVEVPPESFSIDEAIEERSIARLQVRDPSGSMSFDKGNEVLVYDDTAALVYRGYVDSAKYRATPPNGSLLHTLTAVDGHYHADKRVAAESYEGQLAGTIVTDLITKYLAAEGITAGTIQNGPTIVAAVLNYVPVSKALDELAEKAGFVWYVDQNLALHFLDRSTDAAPWTLTETDLDDMPEVSRGNPAYRNRQYVRGGLDTTDPQTETRLGDSKIKAWPMSYPLAKVPTITVNGAAKTVGIRGLETGKDFYWSKGDAVISQDEDATPLTAAQTLSVTYQGEFQIIALAEDPVEIEERQTAEGGGTTGYVDGIVSEPNANTRAAAFEVGVAKLDHYATVGRQLTCTVSRSGLRAGQLLTVNVAELGLSNETFLITSVDTYAIDGLALRWRVTAVQGPVVDSWTKFLAKAREGEAKFVDFLSVGAGQILALLVRFSEAASWSEEVTQTVHTCQVPSASLYPSSTLYPC